MSVYNLALTNEKILIFKKIYLIVSCSTNYHIGLLFLWSHLGFVDIKYIKCKQNNFAFLKKWNSHLLFLSYYIVRTSQIMLYLVLISVYLLLKSRVFALENFVANTNFNTKQGKQTIFLWNCSSYISDI